MSSSDARQGQVAASAAEVYDEFFVPALFGQWVPIVLDRAEVAAGQDVLDVGCGTGRLATAAAQRVGPSGAVTGLDRNDGMLAVARRSGGVAWRQGDAHDLPFPDASFDRVTCAFVLMFLDDPAVALAETVRVLRPGGRLVVATWAEVAASPGYADLVALLRAVSGEAAAQALLAPFSLGAPEAVLAAAGSVVPGLEVHRHEGVARFPSLEAWMHTEIRGWTLAEEIDEATYDRLVDEARGALARHIGEDGVVSFAAPALLCVAGA